MKKGFTLAEVLITLGIIGVVAALTLPQLIAHYNDMVIINKAKKVYSTITQTLQMAQVENGTIGENSGFYSKVKSVNDIAKDFAKYNSGSKYCAPSSNRNECKYVNYFIKSALKTSSGGSIYGNTNPSVLLSDGTVLYFTSRNSGCDDYLASGPLLDSNGEHQYDENGNIVVCKSVRNDCGTIMFDVNGVTPPNQFGHDAFEVTVFKNSITPNGYWDNYGSTSLKNILAGKKNPFVYYKYKN